MRTPEDSATSVVGIMMIEDHGKSDSTNPSINSRTGVK